MKDRKPAAAAGEDFRRLLVLLDDLAATYRSRADGLGEADPYGKGLHRGNQQMAEFIAWWVSERLEGEDD